MVRVVRLERTVSWSQTRRDTNFAIPGYSISAIIPRRGRKSKIFCLWSFMWSKPLLCCFRQSGKILQTQASQGFATFRSDLSRIQPRHSQSWRATNCAIPGYSIFLHDTMRRRKKQVFRVCGQCCGQARFCGGIFRRGISAAGYCPKDFQAFTFWGMDRLSILPNHACCQLRYIWS